ncbi:protein-methionine-sulfoxide reductase heme-binding subunit MsrQ [Dinoroseobacter sp. S124A]|uniref:protein-methionine-sulfoxide reductase heme-binding subunit MsrQ n=1 Tax=Dinoroseobacter sp. S124A TaxID=3415128 RepID=UPI003C7B2092
MIDRLNHMARKLPNWVFYVLGPLPAAWLLWQGITGALGVDPVKVIEHELGLIALQLLIAGLLITPLRRYAGLNLIKWRRPIGILAFVYVVFHLLVWVLLDMQLYWDQMLRDIAKRPYITIGMASCLLLLPLAVTSNNRSLRRMGAASWTKLHRLVYPAILLGGVHFVMVQKVWEAEALAYLAVILGLLALRLRPLMAWLSTRRAARNVPGSVN